MFSVEQELKPEDKLARLDFCMSLKKQIAQNDGLI